MIVDDITLEDLRKLKETLIKECLELDLLSEILTELKGIRRLLKTRD
jgi:hypothetical protein